MVKGLSLLLILFLSGETLSQDSINITNNPKLKTYNEHNIPSSYIDLIIEDYVNQEWNTEESVCFRKTLAIMNNVKNSTLWATWIWDSMQSPVGLLYGSKYNLGNYDECLKAPWLETHPDYRTQYCLADIKLSNKDPSYISIDPEDRTEEYINSKSKYRGKFNTFMWGVCVPKECQPESISKFVKSLLRNNHLGNTISRSEIKVDSCQEAGSPLKFSTEFYAATFFLTAMIVAVVICTAINYENNKHGNKVIKAFCLKTNILSLNHSPDGDIKAMHGLRFISSCGIILFHLVHISVFFGISNTVEYDKYMDRYNLKAFYQIQLIVDTFLMMSGFLFIKSFMDSGRINPVTAILKRYIRLVVFMWLIIVPFKYITRYAGDGPLWPRMMEKEIEICNKNSLITFLMLGNYVDITNMCYPVMWSVPCDFHLSVVGIILAWLFKKNQKLAIISFLTLGVASIILPGFVTYQQNWRGVPIFDIENIVNYRHFLMGNPTYVFSHLRAASYFVGVAAGYILCIYNPSNRKLIPRFWSTVGFVIAVSVAIKLLTMSAYFYNKGPSPTWEDAFHASLNRPIWALAMLFIIVFCEYGTVPFAGEFLKWRFFIPLSKLSYGLYLLHSFTFTYTKAITRTTIHFNIVDLFSSAVWIIATCCVFSFLLYIFYEAPMVKIINIILDKSIRRINNNGCEKSSDHRNVTHETLENKTKIT